MTTIMKDHTAQFDPAAETSLWIIRGSIYGRFGLAITPSRSVSHCRQRYALLAVLSGGSLADLAMSGHAFAASKGTCGNRPLAAKRAPGFHRPHRVGAYAAGEGWLAGN
jgi:hypothetical protein